MRYYFNSLRKMDFKTLETSQIMKLIKFHYTTGKIEKKEFKYLIKKIYKIRGRKNKWVQPQKKRDIK